MFRPPLQGDVAGGRCGDCDLRSKLRIGYSKINELACQKLRRMTLEHVRTKWAHPSEKHAPKTKS